MVENKKVRGRKIKGKTEFAKLLKENKMTIKEFCKKWGVKYITARKWSCGFNPAPKIVLKLLQSNKKD